MNKCRGNQIQNTKATKRKIRNQIALHGPLYSAQYTPFICVSICVCVCCCVDVFLNSVCVHHWLLLGYKDFSTTFRNKQWDVKEGQGQKQQSCKLSALLSDCCQAVNSVLQDLKDIQHFLQKKMFFEKKNSSLINSYLKMGLQQRTARHYHKLSKQTFILRHKFK